MDTAQSRALAHLFDETRIIMNIRHNAALRQKLAAEYVLGTLKGGARHRFDGWLHGDADLRRIVAEWQQRLAPMAEFSSSVAPRSKVWRNIERSLKLKPVPALWQFWLQESVLFWRSLGIASTAIATLLVAVVVSNPLAPSAISDVATLSDGKTGTALLVTANRSNRTIEVRVLAAAAIAADKSLQLWAVPKSGNPRSLGVLADSGRATLDLSDSAIGADVTLLAVSLEPRGGSLDPNGPSGPILYTGNWVRL
jgi:anti-sigma-K factor RskA